MSETVLAIVHQDDVQTGTFGPTVAEYGYELEVASFVEGREPRRQMTEYAAVVVFGGSAQVDEEHVHPWLAREKRAMSDALDADIPTLGICLGGQLLAELSGGRVGPTDKGRRGWTELQVCPEATDDPIFGPLRPSFRTVSFHLYEFHLPPGATPLARTETTLQAFRLNGANVWGVQFHPEATHAAVVRWGANIEAMRLPEIGADYVRQYLADNDRFAAEHEQLGTTMCGRFLEVALA